MMQKMCNPKIYQEKIAEMIPVYRLWTEFFMYIINIYLVLMIYFVEFMVMGKTEYDGALLWLLVKCYAIGVVFCSILMLVNYKCKRRGPIMYYNQNEFAYKGKIISFEQITGLQFQSPVPSKIAGNSKAGFLMIYTQYGDYQIQSVPRYVMYYLWWRTKTRIYVDKVLLIEFILLTGLPLVLLTGERFFK